MKRIFICSTSRYPHGSPAAQRIHYLAKTLKGYGISPFIITNGYNIDVEFDQEKQVYCHKTIYYRNVDSTKGSFFDLLKRANKTIEIIRNIGFSQGDYILVCTAIPFFGNTLFSFARKNGMQSIADKTEWFQPWQFEFGRFNPFFCLANYYFKHTILKADKLIVISKTLEHYFQSKGKSVFTIPIVTDAEDYSLTEKEYYEKVIIVYPGTPGKKDDFVSLLGGLSILSDKMQARVEFHLTSLKEDQVKQYVTESKYEKLKKMIVYHGWMEYNDLLDLYNRAHYTLIIKPNNIVTASNFPSKVPELMACGVVPIITKYGDITTYLDKGNAIFVESNTEEAVCSALQYAINLNSSIRREMSINARKSAETVFDYKAWIHKFGSFIDGKGD